MNSATVSVFTKEGVDTFYDVVAADLRGNVLIIDYIQDGLRVSVGFNHWNRYERIVAEEA